MREVVRTFLGTERRDNQTDPAEQSLNGSFRSAFTLLNDSSIGLKSGEYWGK